MSTPNAMNNQPGYGPPMSQQQPQGPPPQGPPAPQGYPVQQTPMMSQPSQAPPGMSQGQQMPPQQSMMQQSQASSANMMGGPSGGPPPSSQPMGSRAMPPPNAYRRSPSQGRLNMQGEKIFFRKWLLFFLYLLLIFFKGSFLLFVFLFFFLSDVLMFSLRLDVTDFIVLLLWYSSTSTTYGRWKSLSMQSCPKWSWFHSDQHWQKFFSMKIQAYLSPNNCIQLTWLLHVHLLIQVNRDWLFLLGFSSGYIERTVDEKICLLTFYGRQNLYFLLALC